MKWSDKDYSFDPKLQDAAAAELDEQAVVREFTRDPTVTESSDATIARLVELSPVLYDQCREAAAERLGIRM